MKNRKKFAFWFWSVTAALAVLGFFSWLFFFRYFEFTNDAYVHGNQVYITPLHSGFVTSIHTDDTFLVKKGELLVVLDKTDAIIALQKAEEELAQTVRQVCEMFHQVFVYRAEIDAKTAEFIRNAQDYIHRERVYQEEGVSLEDFEHSIAALRAQYASLEMTAALYHKALSLVQNTSIKTHPLVIAASDKVRDAWVYLYRCDIYSPVEGLAAQRTIQVGMWVPAGQPLMSVIPLDQIWVNANYKETQLKRMRVGQKIDITVDLWGVENVFHGTIVGLPGGAGNAFSLLPPQNLSGNWIKIVQRLPVRVALDPEELKARPLRLGLSCEALVDTRQGGDILVPTTTAGSPLYSTPIFEEEEKGDYARFEEIISANLDPKLSSYASSPLEMPLVEVRFLPLLKEALGQEEFFQKQILMRKQSGN